MSHGFNPPSTWGIGHPVKTNVGLIANFVGGILSQRNANGRLRVTRIERVSATLKTGLGSSLANVGPFELVIEVTNSENRNL